MVPGYCGSAVQWYHKIIVLYSKHGVVFLLKYVGIQEGVDYGTQTITFNSLWQIIACKYYLMWYDCTCQRLACCYLGYVSRDDRIDISHNMHR